MFRTTWMGAAALSAAMALSAPALAAQIVLSGSAVIGSTPSFPGPYEATSIFDQQTGTIAGETFNNGDYWLNPNNGPAGAYITIDLGAAYNLTAFELFNTSNGHLGDRGTGAFSIVASNAIIADGANGFTLDGPTATLLSGVLVAQAPSVARVMQSFGASHAGDFRYIQFRPHAAATATAICCGITSNYGLNELRVFGDPASAGAIPEPTTWALMILGFASVGGALRRQRRSAANGRYSAGSGTFTTS